MDELYDDLEPVTDTHKVQRISKILFIAGAAAVMTYLLISSFTNKKKKKKKSFSELELVADDKKKLSKSASESELGKMIKDHISAFLLGLARQKLHQLICVLNHSTTNNTKQ